MSDIIFRVGKQFFTMYGTLVLSIFTSQDKGLAKIFGRSPKVEDCRISNRYSFVNMIYYNESYRPELFRRLSNFFHKTLSTSIRNRWSDIKILIDELDKLIKLANLEEQYLLSNFHYNAACFVGRFEELPEIHNALTENHVVFLSGIGGIGKTELAKRYADEYKDYYDTVSFAYYEQCLEHTISGDLVINNFDLEEDESEQDVFLRIISILKETASERDLIIIDNFDVESDNRLAELLECPCTFLFTTRKDFRDYNFRQLIVGRISNNEELVKLFSYYNDCNYEIEERKFINKLIDFVDGHTMTVELISKYLRDSAIVPSELYDLFLEKEGITNTDDTIVRQRKDKMMNAESVNRHLLILFDTSNFDSISKEIIGSLSLFAGTRIKNALFEKICKVDDYEKRLSLLINHGWIEYNETNHKISLHQVIQDLIYSNFIPSTETCPHVSEGMYDYMNEDTVNYSERIIKRRVFDIFVNRLTGNDILYARLCLKYGKILKLEEAISICEGMESSDSLKVLVQVLIKKIAILGQCDDMFSDEYSAEEYCEQILDKIKGIFEQIIETCYKERNLGQQCIMLVDACSKIDEVLGDDLSLYFDFSIGVSRTYGTERIEALHILEKTLNMKTVSVTEEIPCLTNVSGKKRVINKAETVMALEKQQKLIDEFKKWVWKDEIRKKRLESIFENNFSCVRRRIFDGSFLQFPTMSSSVHLYPYQKDAVARIIFTPNTLLAHDVGSGKTYVMVAAGQELRRMGMSKKNLYVVPNNIIGEWERIFLTMYPNAKLLIVESKYFAPSKRENVLLDIKNNDYDGILMTYSCFEQIPLSKSYYTDELETKKEMISDLVLQKSKATSKLKKKKEALEKALSELAVEMDNVYDTVCFDELGITRLFVDEAHNFKNVPIETNAKMVSGISSSGSKKCKDMMDKVHMVQKQNDGKGVVFATGTPITNSITDVYIMQQYLQHGELALLELQSFDSWIGMFAEKVTEFEIDVDINSYRLVTRFSKFHNLPELTSLLCSIADFHQINENAGIPKMDGYSDTLVSKTMEFADYLNSISQRVDDIRHGCVNRSDDNMLKITTDGRRAALDLRLVDPTSSFTYQSKVARCAENVADIYFKTSRNKSTQLIFCDTSVPKPGFNIYDELKDRLIMLGVPECQVAFIHSANTEAKRACLFAKVRKGTVRILIGSTFKLGLGVNIQNKLIALHHMDVPWRPSDMTQREGRIIRHGNENPNVKIFRYITEGSFDAYSWQLLETKQRFITGLLSGTMTERSGADIDNIVLDYAEVKALAIGNPLIKERVEVANELTRYMILQRKFIESRMCLEKELLELPGKIEYQENTIQKCMDDVLSYSEWKQQYAPINNTGLKKDVFSRRKILREKISQAVKENVLRTAESYLMDYCGFNVILPANMTLEKPYVWLERNGRYYVELGDSEVGNLIRIEKFLDNLSCYLEKLKIGLCRLQEKESEIKADLAKSESYLDEIAKYKKRLEVIDKKLGVIKK